ncbi:MAG: inositol monophosphatase, partial [Burkholderiaceae bacterium]|nr:inositol monophosphatase [Burkholderiaceae bacterium]
MKPVHLKDDLAERCRLAQEITREAGALAKAAFLNRGSLTVKSKGTQDWVSNIDLEVEDLIRARLNEFHPDEQILGEEHGGAAGVAGNGMWVVDPIDGTTCFLLGLPQWCVVLCYVINGAPLVAAIYNPMTSEMYSAISGRGALLNDAPIRVADADSITAGLVSVGASQHD